MSLNTFKYRKLSVNCHHVVDIKHWPLFIFVFDSKHVYFLQSKYFWNKKKSFVRWKLFDSVNLLVKLFVGNYKSDFDVNFLYIINFFGVISVRKFSFLDLSNNWIATNRSTKKVLQNMAFHDLSKYVNSIKKKIKSTIFQSALFAIYYRQHHKELLNRIFSLMIKFPQ